MPLAPPTPTPTPLPTPSPTPTPTPKPTIKQEAVSEDLRCTRNITGQEQPKYFRFPYGAYNLHLLDLVSQMGYTSIFWSTAMVDWEPRKNGADDAYNDVMNMLHDGDVILMHQGSEDDINALDRIIKAIKAKGYSFSTVADFK